MSVKKTTILATGLALVFLLFGVSPVAAGEKPLGSADFRPSPERPVGWRGDGSGKFPGANPPVNWSRVSESILQLRTQATKPNEKDEGVPVPGGVLREWLVAGPLPLPDGFTDFKKEIMPDEAAVEPAENDKYGSGKWTKVVLDSACLDFKSLFGPDFVTNGAPVRVAYAHAWVKSPTNQSLRINQMSKGKDVAFRVNGKTATAGDGYQSLALTSGWNHLAFRVVSNPVKEQNNNSWYIRPVLFGAPDSAYRSENIAWTTAMPGLGVGGPIIVGEKLFATAEMTQLLCLSKKTGEILWIRPNTWYDALTEQERQAPALEGLKGPYEKLLELNKKCVGKVALTSAEWNERAAAETSLHAELVKLDPKKYVSPQLLRSEAGFAAPTPVSDGKYVYASFGNCALACYDLEGNRQWIACAPYDPHEHGHTTSPILVGDKVIVYWNRTFAFDKKTGKQLWENYIPSGPGVSGPKFHGTPCVIRQGDQDYIYEPMGELIRASDGKTLLFDYLKLRTGVTSPVLADGRIYANGAGPEDVVKVFDFPAIGPEKAEPRIIWSVSTAAAKFPFFYRGEYIASPLLHEGLLYCVSVDGLLTVMDAATGKIEYQKVLDLDVWWSHVGDARRGGIGACPALAGNYIYLWGNQGACLVIKPGRKYEQVAKNRIENVISPKHYTIHQEVFINCPLFDGDRIYCRGDANLYCIEKKK